MSHEHAKATWSCVLCPSCQGRWIAERQSGTTYVAIIRI